MPRRWSVEELRNRAAENRSIAEMSAHTCDTTIGGYCQRCSIEAHAAELEKVAHFWETHSTAQTFVQENRRG